MEDVIDGVLKSADIEHVLTGPYGLFSFRKYLVVPNVWWGLGFNHECDLLCVTKSRIAHEIEIKVSVADLKVDLKKKHGHKSNKIRYLWFAMPEKVYERGKEYIPENAGIIIIKILGNKKFIAKTIRKPMAKPASRSLSQDEIIKLGFLGTMRYWKMAKGRIHES